jgi:hypothetical protein
MHTPIPKALKISGSNTASALSSVCSGRREEGTTMVASKVQIYKYGRAGIDQNQIYESFAGQEHFNGSNNLYACLQ